MDRVGNSSYRSSPVSVMSERSPSISSFVDNVELSSGPQVSTYSSIGSLASTPLLEGGQLPCVCMNVPLGVSTHNLPVARILPVNPYLMSTYAPFSANQPAPPESWSSTSTFAPASAWNAYSYLTTDFQAQARQIATLPLAHIASPAEGSTWTSQQNPASAQHTSVMLKSQLPRCNSIAVMAPSATEPVTRGGNVKCSRGHKRGFSCSTEQIEREWDDGAVFST